MRMRRQGSSQHKGAFDASITACAHLCRAYSSASAQASSNGTAQRSIAATYQCGRARTRLTGPRAVMTFPALLLPSCTASILIPLLLQRGYDVWGCYMSPVADAYGKKGMCGCILQRHHCLHCCCCPAIRNCTTQHCNTTQAETCKLPPPNSQLCRHLLTPCCFVILCCFNLDATAAAARL